MDKIIAILLSTVFTASSFTITYYCPCQKCCGTETGITATGTKATAERTVAVDANKIPLGSTVVIDGKFYIAEDTGVKGNHIDIFVDNHNEALKLGTTKKEVIVLPKE